MGVSALCGEQLRVPERGQSGQLGSLLRGHLWHSGFPAFLYFTIREADIFPVSVRFSSLHSHSKAVPLLEGVWPPGLTGVKRFCCFFAQLFSSSRGGMLSLLPLHDPRGWTPGREDDLVDK